MLVTAIWLLFFSFSPANAETGSSVVCEPFYQLYTQCHLVEGESFGEPYSVQLDAVSERVESQFRFEYRYNCEHEKLPLFWRSDSQLIPLVKTMEWMSAVIEGAGVLQLYLPKTYAARSERFHFSSECRVDVRNLAVRPSSRTMNDWRKKFSEYSERIFEASYTLTKLNDLLLVRRAFDFVTQLAQWFISELSSSERQKLYATLHQVKPVLQEVVDNPEHSLTHEHRRVLGASLAVVETMNDPKQWLRADGSAKSLADFLAPEDQVILEDLARRFVDEAEYERYLLLFNNKLNLWTEKLQTLRSLLAEWEGVE